MIRDGRSNILEGPSDKKKLVHHAWCQIHSVDSKQTASNFVQAISFSSYHSCSENFEKASLD